ncbi:MULTISPECIES: 1,4-alpha-glucan branching protein GlgB [unclassified Prochlorococcus]|uniref:1,4-alpha-glucan branching protein GlgB n=1 Tax=unclassified Prochlorococcus TaxID=2627481 RepID=UPI0005338BB8|nr:MULTISPECIES: 1,4-alpha-glucan branching protein GlgB [unclassified Prochlorococcus]KGG15403.1 1,4-alpha-glucan (glycogen) branching enzyme, GH-13-type [Prochlorococcus sp. MIT 0602]
MSAGISIDWMVDEGKKLAECKNDNPLGILGPQPFEAKWALRVWMPEADQVTLILNNQEIPLTNPNHPWVFETLLEENPGSNYEVKVERGGITHSQKDPWAFRHEWMGEIDRHLFAEGNHHHIWRRMGAHSTTLEGIEGVIFCLWAPNARSVSVIGDLNSWDGRHHPMQRRLGGIWELFIPGLKTGDLYKYEIRSQEGHCYQKADPYGFQHEVRPAQSSVISSLDQFNWKDKKWMDKRDKTDQLNKPISVYEAHLGSWKHASVNEPFIDKNSNPREPVPAADLKPGSRFLTYTELTEQLIPYVKARGFTHIELMPISEHPFDGSWGYQVTGWYAPTSRYGSPDEFRAFVDKCHSEGIGVILDWVPGHFPKDEHGLAFFDGSHLYEHSDPRIGEHKEWGTLIFNYSRNEVRNFLVANLIYWFEQFHIDGIRVDAVASMLYKDYLRPEGEWIPNEDGGNENFEAVNFLQQANHVLFQHFPGALSIAEESTTWSGVTKPTDMGGLGFNLKWNMGWMHDMLDYFEIDPWFRQFHQNNVTFSICYNYTENFMLSLSHDEVVHGKSHLLHKMPGDDWKKYANTRALLAYMWTHPGKKTIFMGMEFGQRQEWNVWDDLQWDLLEYDPHRGIRNLIDDLNLLYKSQPALWRDDFKEYGFQWIDCKDNSNSVISFMRRENSTGQWLIIVANFTPETHSNYRVGVPMEGYYEEIFNTDSDKYGGSNVGNLGGKQSEQWNIHDYENAIELSLPPLSVIVFKHTKKQQQKQLR